VPGKIAELSALDRVDAGPAPISCHQGNGETESFVMSLKGEFAAAMT
jgi:hypothetical protein